MDHLKSRLGVVLARMVRKFLLWNCFYLLMFNHFFPGNATQPWNLKLGTGVDCKRNNMARGFSNFLQLGNELELGNRAASNEA